MNEESEKLGTGYARHKRRTGDGNFSYVKRMNQLISECKKNISGTQLYLHPKGTLSNNKRMRNFIWYLFSGAQDHLKIHVVSAF